MKRRTLTALLLALLLPGAGHFFLRRAGRGAAFFVIIISLFVIGLSIDGRLYTPEGGLLNQLATLASAGIGLPYFVARQYGALGNIRSITFEYGTTFTLTAGLMNLLLLTDVYDLAESEEALPS
jgi:hypothetical protein